MFNPLCFLMRMPCPEIISLLGAKVPLGKCSVSKMYLYCVSFSSIAVISILERCCNTYLTITTSALGKSSFAMSKHRNAKLLALKCFVL